MLNWSERGEKFGGVEKKRYIRLQSGMNSVINDFLRHLEAEMNMAANTVAAYRRDLRDWEQWTTGDAACELDVASVTAGDLRAWLGHETRRGLSGASVKRKASALRSLFHYLHQKGMVGVNPASRLVTPKLPKPLPVFVRAGEMRALLDTDDALAASPFIAARNRLIVDMLYSAGMRCSELTELTDGRVDTAAGTLRLIGKRRMERIVPIGPELCRAIDDYRAMRSAEGLPSEAGCAFFVRPDGEPIGRRAVYSIVHRMMQQAGVHASRLSPHVLRHSCATDLLNAGADLNSVREMLGHASLATTQIYTHLTYKDLQNNYNMAHPRAAKHERRNTL